MGRGCRVLASAAIFSHGHCFSRFGIHDSVLYSGPFSLLLFVCSRRFHTCPFRLFFRTELQVVGVVGRLYHHRFCMSPWVTDVCGLARFKTSSMLGKNKPSNTCAHNHTLGFLTIHATTGYIVDRNKTRASNEKCGMSRA